jgi:hypothetical protein
VRSRERLDEAESRYDQEHGRLTRALFESSGDASGHDPLEQRIADEQAAKEEVEEARSEHERAWASAEAAVPGLEPSAHSRGS